MKKLLYCAAALATLLFAGSCQRENLEPAQENSMVTFSIEVPAAMQTKAIADGSNVDQLVYEVWLTKTLGNLKNGQLLYHSTVDNAFTDGKATLPLDLVNNQNFTVLFWAQNAAAAAYDANDLTAVTYAKTSYLSNNDDLAAFYAVAYVADAKHVKKDGTATSGEVKLTRPFAQLNLGTLNVVKDFTVKLVSSTVTVDKAPTKFNVATNETSEEKSFTFADANVPAGELEVNGTKYQYVAMNYLFAGSNLTVDYTIKAELIPDGATTGTVSEITNQVKNVPVDENYRTNIIGNLLTSKTDYEIVIDAEFAGEAPETYVVKSKEELDQILKSNEEEIHVVLGADVDLTANDAYLKLGGADTETIIIDGTKVTTKSTAADYYTLNLATTYWSRLNTVNPDAKIVLRNLNLTSSQKTGTWNSYDVTFQCNVEMENVNVLKALALDGADKTAVLKNVTISESHDYYALWISAAGQTVSLEDVNINSKGRGIKIDDQYVGDATKLVTLNVDGLKVKSSNKAAIMVKTPKGAHITLKDVDITEVKADTSNEVWIDEDASSYINKVTVTGGSMIVEGQETVTIDSMETLKSELTSAGEAGAGYTVLEISSDIDMTGQKWTPIEVDGYNGADIVTIDGKGHTIKGLTSSLFAGGFAGGSGIVIKNLTIEDANMIATSTQGYGAFVNCADAMDVITLINCHLKNSTITTPNNGQAESRIGGLVGWTAGYNNQNDGPVDSYITIQNCSVTGCTFTGWGSIGGICGHAGANAATFTTIENCTITNNKFISTDDGGWRTGVVVGTANNGQCVINNITESGKTLIQEAASDLKNPEGEKRNYYGRFVPAGTGSLTIDGVAVK